jgi:hypothetical protein
VAADLISDKEVAAAVVAARSLYEPLTSWAAAEIWNRPQA